MANGKNPKPSPGGFLTELIFQGIGNQLQEQRNKKAYQQQLEMMDIQHQNQMALNQQGHDLQYQMWQQTNYPAQLEMMKKAGLNPALMYGMSGGGGTTTGSQGGGQAAGGTAPSQPQVEMFGLQAKMMEAQINKLNAEATKISGVDTSKLQEEILKLEKESDILQKDINWYEKNNIAPSEYGVIKALQSTRGIFQDDLNKILGMTWQEKLKALLGLGKIDEKEKGNLELIYDWEKENDKIWNGEPIPGLK